MAVIPWVDDIRKRKVLTVFPTAKVTGEWLRVFRLAIAEFNKLSEKTHGLGVTLASPSNVKRPDPVGDDGAEVQFDLGNGRLEYEALGRKFVAEDNNGNPINFSPFELHGATQMVRAGGGYRRAFIFVPETPMVDVSMKASDRPDHFKQVQRAAGSGIKLFIAVHEFVHACGLSNAEHNFQGANADVFTTGASVSAVFDKPEDDKFLLHANHPNPPVFGPPITIKKKVADMIRDNWK